MHTYLITETAGCLIHFKLFVVGPASQKRTEFGGNFSFKRPGSIRSLFKFTKRFNKKDQFRFVVRSFPSLRTFARKTSTIQIFFILWLQLYNELPMSEMEKNWGVTDFVFEIKHVKNYPNFDKSALITRHGLSAC